MTDGILLGLASAFGFGTSDTLTTYAARRIGTFATASLGLLFSSIGLLALLAVTGQVIPQDVGSLLPALGLGVLLGIAYVAITQALRLGPLMVVGPLSASGGAVTVVLAVVLLHDAPSPSQWLAVPVSLLGVALVAFVVDEPQHRRVGRGAVFAAIYVGFLSVYYVGLGQVVGSLGALQTAFVTRTVSAVFAWVLLLMVLGRRRVLRSTEHAAATLQAPALVPSDAVVTAPPSTGMGRPPRRIVAILVVGGMINAVALAAVSYAMTVGPTSIVGLMALLSPAVVITVGFLVFGERLTRLQWSGVLLTAAGAVLATRA